MREIWKFPCPNPYVARNLDVEMPDGATIVHFDRVDTELFLWAEVNVAAPKVTRRFTIRGTGWTIDDNVHHRGTVISGQMVWHLYEVVTKPVGAPS